MWSLRSNATLGSVASGNGKTGPLVFGLEMRFWAPKFARVHVAPPLLEVAISPKIVGPGASFGSLRTQTAASLFGFSGSMAIVGLLSLPSRFEISTWLFACTVGVGS